MNVRRNPRSRKKKGYGSNVALSTNVRKNILVKKEKKRHMPVLSCLALYIYLPFLLSLLFSLALLFPLDFYCGWKRVLIFPCSQPRLSLDRWISASFHLLWLFVTSNIRLFFKDFLSWISALSTTSLSPSSNCYLLPSVLASLPTLSTMQLLLIRQRQRTAAAPFWAAVLVATIVIGAITGGHTFPGVFAAETTTTSPSQAAHDNNSDEYRLQQQHQQRLRREIHSSPPGEPPFIKNRHPEAAYQPSLAEIDAARKSSTSGAAAARSLVSHVKGHAFDRIVQIWLENQDFEVCIYYLPTYLISHVSFQTNMMY